MKQRLLIVIISAFVISGAATVFFYSPPSAKAETVSTLNLSAPPAIVITAVPVLDYHNLVIERPAMEVVTLKKSGKIKTVLINRIIPVAHAPPKNRYWC